MQTDMRHLQLVRAIADAGSLTQAGLVLHLTQSALSHQLRDIESRLGAKLFTRAGRGLTLTAAGETLLKTATEVISLVERSEDAIRQQAGPGRELLRLTTECYTCYHWLSPVLQQYQRLHPSIEVRIDVTATNHPIAALIEGQIDLALVSDRPQDRRVITRDLFYDEYAVIVHPGHPLADRAFVRPQDFATETLLTYSPPSNSTVYQRLLAPAGVAPARFLQVQLTEAIIEMAKAGLGIGVVSTWAVAPHVATGALRAIPLTRRRFGRTWSAAALTRVARQPHMSDFIDILLTARPFELRGPRRSAARTTTRSAAARRSRDSARSRTA